MKAALPRGVCIVQPPDYDSAARRTERRLVVELLPQASVRRLKEWLNLLRKFKEFHSQRGLRHIEICRVSECRLSRRKSGFAACTS
jgi:hypothetical protein